MRSRYTAFVLGDVRHLTDTWFPGTRPADVSVDASIEWRGLRILRAETAPDGRSGRVAFEATWSDRKSGEPGVLEEDSRFVKRAGRWFYVEAL